MRTWAVIVAVLATTGCGSSSPTSPTPATPAPTPATVTLSGHVTATNGGQALSGVSARLGAAAVTTDGAGAFVAQGLSPALSMQLALTGSSIVPRTVMVAVTSTRDVSVSAIALGGGFDLTFYRAFVRNASQTPAALEPLRRLSAAPSVYLRTVDEAGQAIDGATLAAAAAAVAGIGSAWTGGRFGVAAVQQGAETREGQAGWLTIKWPVSGMTGFCGLSDVGRDGGTISLNVVSATCGCNGSRIRPSAVKHELGHAFGFYHTGDASDLMSGLANTTCDQSPSARELAHAAIAYARPIGNVDPDTDPAGAVNLAPMRIH